MAGMARLSRMATVTPAILNIAQMGDQLIGYLALGPNHLLEIDNFVDENFIGLGELKVLFLQGLYLMLSRRQ